jgi:hypothetical protein
MPVLEQLVRWWKWPRMKDAFPVEGGGMGRAGIEHSRVARPDPDKKSGVHPIFSLRTLKS